MIDARRSAGVPCITTCPAVVPRSFVVPEGAELHEWQVNLLAAHGFLIEATPTSQTPLHKPPTTR